MKHTGRRRKRRRRWNRPSRYVLVVVDTKKTGRVHQTVVFFQAIAVPVVPFVRLRVKSSRSQLDKMSSAAVASSLTARSYGYIDTINPLTCPEVRRAAWAKRWEPEVVDQKVGDDAYSVARWLMKV